MADARPRLMLPPQRVQDLTVLLEVGPQRLETLAKRIDDAELTLDVRAVAERIATSVGLGVREADRLIDVLWMLDGFRASERLEASQFVESLTLWLEQEADTDWRAKHLAAWRSVAPALVPLLRTDSFISFLRKAYELLSAHPANLREYRVLTEIRPLYDDAASRIRALLLTNTLVLSYEEDGQERTGYFSIDLDDLKSMARELERARKKNAVAVRQAHDAKLQLVFYRSTGEGDARNDE